jgi:hypothetical protein
LIVALPMVFAVWRLSLWLVEPLQGWIQADAKSFLLEKGSQLDR